MSSPSSVGNEVDSLLNELRQRDIRIHAGAGSLHIRGARANLTPALAQRIQSMKAELLDHLLETERRSAISAPIAHRSPDAPLPLSFMQQNLWLIDRIDGSAHYNMASALDIEGCFDTHALERALRSTIERHESLRTVFRIADDGIPRQVVLPTFDFKLEEIDLTALGSEAQAAEVSRLGSLEASRSFDLGNDVMMRSLLLRLGHERFVLLNTKHHIASDGTSLDVLLDEICALYEAYRKDEPSPLPPLPIQYADYSVWLSQWLQGDVLQRKLDYWKRQLAHLPVMHRLPLDRPRPALRTTRGARHSRTYPLETHAALRALCSAHDVTYFMLMQAAFAVFLSRWSGERDIVVATPISTRNRPELVSMIGYFSNTLVLRSDCDGDLSFLEFLRVSKAMILDAQEHRHAPFEMLVEQINPPRSLAYNALAQISFMMPNSTTATIDAIELPGVRIVPIDADAHVAMKFDLELTVRESRRGLSAMWGFNTDIFDHATIERMDRHFECLLQSIAAAPGESLTRLRMSPDAEDEPMTFLPATPMAGNGEVDAGASLLRAPAEPDAPPSTPLEQRLSALWAQVLHRTPSGMAADFFELGGRSLLASQLASFVHRAFAIDMPVKVVFEHPVLGAQAAWLARQLAGSDTLSPSPAAPVALDPPDTTTAAQSPPADAKPRNPTERTLKAIWAASLDIPVEQISATDSFFEIGGNSRLSIAMQNGIREILGIEIAMADLFRYPTIQDLVRFIDGTPTRHADRPLAPSSAKDRALRARARGRNLR